MNPVPPDERGQVGGVGKAQLLGGTIGMAMSNTLFATTHSYSLIFLANAGLVPLALAWCSVERRSQGSKELAI